MNIFSNAKSDLYWVARIVRNQDPSFAVIPKALSFWFAAHLATGAANLFMWLSYPVQCDPGSTSLRPTTKRGTPLQLRRWAWLWTPSVFVPIRAEGRWNGIRAHARIWSAVKTLMGMRE